MGLKEWEKWKYRTRRTALKNKSTPVKNEEDLIFGSKETEPQHIYQRLRLEFNKVLTAINKDKRKTRGQRRKITMNSFRRFVKTTVADQVNSDFNEWLIGHLESSYYTKKPEEKWQLYEDKCMKYLTFLDYTVLEAKGKSTDAKLAEKDKEMEELKSKMAQMNEMITDMREQGMFDTLRRLESELRTDPTNQDIKMKLEQHKKTARGLIAKGQMSNELDAYGEVKALATNIDTIPKVEATDM